MPLHTNKLLIGLLSVICWSCSPETETEKHQHSRDNVCNIRGKVNEIPVEEVMIGSISRLFLANDHLIIGDYKSADKLIHLFDRKEFRYQTSSTYVGQGPDEITIMGHIGVDEAHRRFFVSDHGKQRIVCYDLDSLLSDPSYAPTEKFSLLQQQFPDSYEYINDTLCFGLVIEPIGHNDFSQGTARWNMRTGEITKMKYTHPEVKKRRYGCAVSVKEGLYVECHSRYDLMTIGRLNGDLVCNVYGPEWDNGTPKPIHCYGKVAFCKDKIVALYSGGDYLSEGYTPTKFFVFDLRGNYLKTLETGYRISDFCYDERYDRILMSLDDTIQFGYFELNGLI